MSVLRISRLNFIRNGRHPTILANFADDASKKGKSSNDKKEEKAKTADNPDDKKEVTSKRLNDLLAEMSDESNLKIVKEVIKPRSSAEKKARKQAAVDDKKESKPPNIAEAAKLVAKTLGGDVKKTESELLSILMKSDHKKGDKDLSSLLGSMEVEKSENPPFQRRSDVVRKQIAQKRGNETGRMDERWQSPRRDGRDHQSRHHQQRDQQFRQPRNYVRQSVDLFGAPPLGIFTKINDLQDSPDTLSTWTYLHNKELKLAVTHPPKNYFEKMALWTDQGKLWKFPIDNEQGMDDEAKIYFTEHIFLEQHLESWCPTKGPVRHFMELVCVGLSKNPYYTVAQKKEHIEWFRDYFAEKKELLDSVIIESVSDTPKELQ